MVSVEELISEEDTPFRNAESVCFYHVGSSSERSEVGVSKVAARYSSSMSRALRGG